MLHMLFSPTNESLESEDIQELIKSSPKCEASTSANDMESGRGARSTSSSPPLIPGGRSDQRVWYRGEEDPTSCSGSCSFFAKYFSVESFLLLMLVTASLLILPLVLPPLPPPPSMLMLVPVAMLLLLLVMAFTPMSGGGRGATGPAYL